jgi:hypothetical protein
VIMSSQLKRRGNKLTIMVRCLINLGIILNKSLGVDNERFLGRKVSPAGITVISKTSEEENFEAREAVYEARRPEIQHKLRLLIIHGEI